MSRGRAGLTASFHGSPENNAPDYLVHTEFGADIWTLIMAAGFTEINVHSLEYPVALAWVGKKNGGVKSHCELQSARLSEPIEIASFDSYGQQSIASYLHSDQIYHELQIELDVALRRIQSLESSRSWRLTAPLRAVKKFWLLRRIRGSNLGR